MVGAEGQESFNFLEVGLECWKSKDCASPRKDLKWNISILGLIFNGILFRNLRDELNSVYKILLSRQVVVRGRGVFGEP